MGVCDKKTDFKLITFFLIGIRAWTYRHTWASEKFFPVGPLGDFSKILGGPKLVKFGFPSRNLENNLFLLKFSKSRGEWPPLPTHMQVYARPATRGEATTGPGINCKFSSLNIQAKHVAVQRWHHSWMLPAVSVIAEFCFKLGWRSLYSLSEWWRMLDQLSPVASGGFGGVSPPN